MHRPLTAAERTDVLAWAKLERNGVPVPLSEICELVRQVMSSAAPNGMLPCSLRYATLTVQSLARAPLSAVLSPRHRTSRRLHPVDEQVLEFLHLPPTEEALQALLRSWRGSA